MMPKQVEISALPMMRAPTMDQAVQNVVEATRVFRAQMAAEAHSLGLAGDNNPSGSRHERHMRIVMDLIDMLHGTGADYCEVEPWMALLDDLEAVSSGSTPPAFRPAPGSGLRRQPPLPYSVITCRAAAAALADWYRTKDSTSRNGAYELVAHQIKALSLPLEYFARDDVVHPTTVKRWHDEANESAGAMGKRGHAIWRELRRAAIERYAGQTEEGANWLMRIASRGLWLKDYLYDPSTPKPQLPGRR